MTESVSQNRAATTQAVTPSNLVGRALAATYGAACYLIFLVTFLYAIGFVGNLLVPKSIDSGPEAPLGESLVINVILLSVFALQHSIMARRGFKQWWTRFVPAVVERSTFVLFATAALALLLWQWQPIPAVIWQVETPVLANALTALSLIGWATVLAATFMINHFELFGLHQVIAHLAGREMPAPHFKTPGLYAVVRHPIYMGFIIAFWATPMMTAGHLLFALVTTGYILVGIALEERDLIAQFGDDYRRYRQRVGMLIPWRRQVTAGQSGRPKEENAAV